jgi:gliding motility-associated-like protein
MWLLTALISLFMAMVPEQVKATHAAGAELTYRSLGGMMYEVDAIFYRDCGGTPEPGNITLTYRSASCSYSRTALAVKVTGVNGQEITLPCTAAPSSCNGGLSTGIRKWIYRAIITLPFACSDWTFSLRVCCRNCVVTTIQSPCSTGSELYVEAGLNNVLAPGNSSPVYGNSPIAFVCLGQNFNYNQGTYDIDGDSLSFELITPKTSATGEVTWVAPASAQAPLTSSTPFTINPLNGDINFTPSMNQIGVMAIRVNEFRNGQRIGSTIRDMQVYTQNCFNTIPYASGVNGTNSFVINACAGQQLCFDIQTGDNDTAQNLSLSWTTSIPGAVVTQTGGPQPVLHFCWTPTLADVNRIPKNFTLLVRDDACPQNGTQSFAYSIFVGNAEVAVTTNDPVCGGTATGSAAISGTPVAGYSYSWNVVPVQTGLTASGLSSGNYSVTAVSPDGCSATASFVINDPSSPMEATAHAIGTVTCQSGNIGVAEVTISGGFSPYTFLWSNGATTSQISQLSAGTYTVTVTDVNGCTSVSSATILQQSGTVSLAVTNVNMVACHGAGNGSAVALPSGGSTPYNYQWSHGATNASVSNLQAGLYTVTVTDANGCTAVQSIQITEPSSAVQAVASVVSNVRCNNGNNGSVSVQVSGGNTPYSYMWSNGSFGQNLNNLPAGNYSLVVTDADGCSDSLQVSVIEPQQPVVLSLLDLQHLTCGQNTGGSISVQASGGTGILNYLWSNGSTTPSISGLAAGTYTVTVTDANGCEVLSAFTVTGSATVVSVSANQVQNVLCFNLSNGSIDINATGDQPLTYLWNNGLTSEDLQNLHAGIYTVTVTDVNGCTALQSFTITQPLAPLIPVLNLMDSIDCFGDTASISVSISGGTSPYQYQWSNGSSSQLMQTPNAGVYTVTVTDSNGCNAIISSDITAPVNPVVGTLVVLSQVKCHGNTDGSLTMNAAGGTAPYTFYWSNGATSEMLSGLTAGNYTVTVTDFNGCTYSESVQIQEPAELAVSSQITSVDCMGNEPGTITLNATGGAAPYTYHWDNGATSSVITSSLPDTFSVVVTDINGCSIQSNYMISGEQNLHLEMDSLFVICVGETVTLTVDSLTATTYQWYYEGNILNGATTNSFTTPAAGNYHVIAVNQCGEIKSDTARVDVKSIGNVSVSNMQIICPPETASLFATGGVTYSWSPASFITFTNIPDPVVSPPTSTTYSVDITNEFGCKTTLSTNIAVACDSLLIPTGFSPNDDGVNDGYVIDGIEEYPGNKLWVYNRYGKLVYKATDYANTWDGVSNVNGLYMGTKLPTGTYFYILDLNDRSKPKAGFIVLRH